MRRPLSQTDLNQLVAIEALTQLAPWSLDVFVRCWEAGYRGWVIEQDQQIVGFVIASYQANEAHILDLCVHPIYQRQGFGKQLIEQALTSARSQNISTSFLEVRRSNRAAIALYDSLGYIQIGERKQYYPAKEGREDALIFAKDLTVQ